MTRWISLFAADDRVELAFLGSGGQVAAKLAERIAGCAAGSAGRAVFGKAALLGAAERFLQLFNQHLRGHLEVGQCGQRDVLALVRMPSSRCSVPT